MELPANIIEFIEAAEQKALATSCNGEVNVVPVSVVRVSDGNIWLHDFFMNKTAKNVCEEPQASLALWSGLNGVQIKGQINYLTEGGDFEAASKWSKEKFPERTLRGLLIFTPETVYDASAKADGAGERLA